MIWCQVFVFLALIEYAMAISWAHFINEKKALQANNNNNTNNAFDMTKLRGHYFGNKNWFKRSGKVIERILIFFYGEVDYWKDPLSRNKVDYCSRILFPFLWIIFTLLYIFAAICPWAVNYND
ncbi:unnamed protein product [Medioppia subpectinata]|uniref:Uncharacterized protein n=1 Tax=Medioppia subpectinata TaxID=1979941 RepID=A0A7R9LU52_9ACAR|nr:unnamed protein product [Medioppia subpectinata]CAG2121762.1 unnamed protein product [Medioppia subpectinata]